MKQIGRKACRMFPIVLLNIVFLLSPRYCIAEENEMCYIKRSKDDVGLCGNPRKDVPCCPEHLTDITVTVYRGYHEDKCDQVYNCGRNNSCCTRTLPINVSLIDIETLKKSFHLSNCFRDVTPHFLATSLPTSTGLELVVISYSCTDSVTTKNAPTKSQTTQYTTTENISNVDVAVSVLITIVVVTAVVAFIIVYLRRYRKSSNKDAIGQPQDVQTNNSFSGLVSMYPGLHLDDCNSTLAVDTLQGTIDVYEEIEDNSVYVKDFATEEDEYQTIGQVEGTVNNKPANDSMKDKDPVGEDDYDHVGNQDTLKSQEPKEYKDITHFCKDDHFKKQDGSRVVNKYFLLEKQF